jgi:alpha-tubulin suppressor-like RCC1 family protein/pimeloyl-ACP methyl ester carboxylesterase
MKQLKTVGLAVLSLFVTSCSSSENSDRPGSEDDPGSLGQAASTTTSPTIATGGAHGCSIFQGGKVVCWGNNQYGQLGDGTKVGVGPTLVSGITTATSVVAGESHSCAVLTDGTVKCWGRNVNGGLGNGTTNDSASPVAVSGITTATGLAAGQYHTCARLGNSTLKCWGKNANGQLGDVSTTQRTTPVSVSGITNATAVAAGYDHSCALLSTGSLKCWGANSSATLGDGTTTQRTSPVSVSGITTATGIAGGATHSCALLSTGSLKCWGSEALGQLGNGGSGTYQKSPVAVTGITTATGISISSMLSCARLSDGTAKCWGQGSMGELGNGTSGLYAYSLTPIAVTGVTTATAISAGYRYACSKLSSGGLQCWGNNASGQLARGTAQSAPLPVTIDRTSMSKVMDVASGRYFTCVLWDTGSVKCFGKNDRGQLGNGSTADSTTPVDVTGITTATSISAGYYHACARLSDGAVKCWGDNQGGQLGSGSGSPAYSTTPVSATGLSTATQVAAGIMHSCARLSDSTVKCWGFNYNSELGFAVTNTPTPTTVPGLSNVVAIAANGGMMYDIFPTFYSEGLTCAVRSTGAVSCWGSNTYGQRGGNPNDPNNQFVTNVPGISTAVSVAIGRHTACAVLSDGTAKCWGANESGQIGNGTTSFSQASAVTVSGLSNVTSIGSSTNGNHFCARLGNKQVKCWGSNANGQIGDGTTANALTPVAASGVTRGMTVSTGEMHSCARQDDSVLKCWGSNPYGQLSTATSQPMYTTAAAPPCSTLDVVRSDYFIAITTAGMPDTSLDGQAGSLDTHRVSPVMFPESCTPAKALLMVHGRTVEAASAFDLQYQNYSFQETMAREGIDTFAVNHLGYGRSSGLDVLDNACNASLPSCLAIGQTCPPPSGVLCDCGLAPTFGVNDQNQQGSTRYLNPNPLTSLCAHTSNTRFNTSATLVADVDVAVNDVLAKTGLSKTSILGYSAGGIDVGNWLSDADSGVRTARLAKIDKAIFVASLFGLPQVTDNEPNTGTTVHSYPLGVLDRAAATAGGFNLAEPTCPGQRDDNIVDPIWAAVKSRDSVGANWGPSQTPPANGGMSRFPHATRWGWNATAAARVTVPVLVMQGLKDNVVPVASSSNLYGALTGTSSKTIVQIGCGSHSIFWEGCSGSSCNGWTGPHETIAKNAKDWITTGMIYASPGSDNGSFGSTDADGTNIHTDAPTTDGPAADESNQTP